jgi:hypothetical protein
MVETRIDRFYISAHSIQNCQSITHVFNPFSDHKLVKLVLSPDAKIKFGKGYWMANRAVLRNARFKEELLRDLTQVSPDKYQTKTEWLQATIQTAKASV